MSRKLREILEEDVCVCVCDQMECGGRVERVGEVECGSWEEG